MGTLKEEAKAYTPKQTKNIAELDKVTTDLEVLEDTFTNKEGQQVTIKVITVNGENYRVPTSVYKSLKAILEENPNLKTFKVKKSGQGLGTEYTVIPLA